MPPKLSGAPWSREYDLDSLPVAVGVTEASNGTTVERPSRSADVQPVLRAKISIRRGMLAAFKERAGIDGVGGSRASLGQASVVRAPSCPL